MTAGLLERPGCAQPELANGRTLEELLGSALDEVRANGSTECPVCNARVTFTRAGAREAECGGCGSRLS
jgi:hypothetical protein